MKKLMFMLAAVACAATMQAATYNWAWSTSDAATTAFESSPATVVNTAIYLFFDQANTSSTLANNSKSATLTTLRTDGKTIENTGYYASAMLGSEDGVLTAQAFTTSSAVKTYAYAVIIADGSDGSQWAYFTANKNATGLETGVGSFQFSISSTNIKDLETTGTGAGWYQIKAGGDVPEPTSGLLLLVGGALLALRRKRA